MEEEETSLPYIPKEILIYNILPRLPVKSLIRFSTVCKQWRSLFTNNPMFAALHNNVENPNEHSYLLKYPNSTQFAVIKDSKLDQIQFNINVTKNSNVCCGLIVVGSIDGVICLVRDFTQFILWNPAMRKYHYTLCPMISNIVTNKSFFGFTRRGCDDFGGFNIVRIVQRKCKHEWMNGDPYCCLPEMEAEVYDSRTDNWAEIGIGPKRFLLCKDECGTIVKGVVYWCSYTWGGSIVSFSPNTWKFSEFKGPGLGLESPGLSWKLGEVSGVLAAFLQQEDGEVGVWKVVADGGGGRVLWVKLSSVVLSGDIGLVLKCWNNGELVLASGVARNHGLVTKFSLYDPWTKTSRLLFEFSSEIEVINEVFLFTESLVPPRGYVASKKL